MKLINKVSISKFRSFGEKTEFSCSDLNVFTGCNDCGKSNIVKALDLFFNNKVGHERFNPDSDFNKWFRDNNERGTRDIVIKIYFAPGNYKDIDGINNGFIAEKIFGIDGSAPSSNNILHKYKLNNSEVGCEKRFYSFIKSCDIFVND